MNEMLKYYSKNNYLTESKRKEIDALYKLNDSALLNKYNDRFLTVIKNANKYSVFYKNYYEKIGFNISDIKDITDINKLPIINRNIIRDNYNQIFNGLNIFKIRSFTSGTSGSPITVYRTPFDIITEQAYVNHYRQLFGFKNGQPLLSIRGKLDKNTPYKLLKNANILYISSSCINENTIEFYFNLIKEFKPVAIEAFPSYLYKFYFELENKQFHFVVNNIFTSSEMLYDFQREKIQKYFNTNIHDWYGNVERSICITQNINNKYYPLPLYSINEFEKNLVITTSLNNTHFPLIRYEVDDRIKVVSNDLIQNILNPDIIHIEGRAGDTIQLKDGSIVGCIDHAFKGVDNLLMAQIFQYNINELIEIKLVVEPAFSLNDELLLKSNLTKMIGDENLFKFSYCTENELVKSDEKKYQLIIKKFTNSNLI